MLISRTTENERKINTNAYDQMMFSFFDLNIIGFKRTLCENGVFLGKSKMAFLAQLNSVFNELREKEICGACVNPGICIDQLPGCEVMEIRYAFSQDLLNELGILNCQPNSPKRPNEEIIRLAFQFKEGKVTKITRTRKYLPSNKKMQDENESSLN